MNNQNYSSNIPASTALANPVAANESQDAPAINANTPRQLVDLTNARREIRAREGMKKNEPPALNPVTSDEIAESELRLHVVASELAVQQYGQMGGAGVPLWAQQMQQTQQQMQQTQQQMQQMQQTQQQMLVIIRNDQIRSQNAKSASYDNNAALHPLMKEHAGWGAPLPGPAGGYGVVPQGAPPTVGVAPAVPFAFPATKIETLNLTNAQIGELSIFYNDTFFIAPNDSVGTRRAKVLKFITG